VAGLGLVTYGHLGLPPRKIGGAQGRANFCAVGPDFDISNAAFPLMKFREGFLAGFWRTQTLAQNQLYR